MMMIAKKLKSLRVSLLSQVVKKLKAFKFYSPYWISIWGFCICIALTPYKLLSSEAADYDANITELLTNADKYKSSDVEKYLQLLEQVKQSKQELNKKQQELLKYLESYKSAYDGKFEDAILGYQEILADSNDEEIKFRAKISLVNIYGIVRNYSEGFSYLQSLIQDIPNIKNHEYRQQGLIIAAFNYNSFQKYDKGLEYSDKLLSEQLTERNSCFAKQLKAEASYHLNTLEVDLKFLDSAALHCERINEMIAASLIHVLKARYFLNNNEPEKAANYLLKHHSLVKSSEYPSILGQYYIVFAKAKLALLEIDEAEFYANKVLEIVDREEYVKSKVVAYSLLHEIAKEKGDFKLALEHYERYSQADKAQINEVLAQQLAYNIVEHQTEEKIQEIKLLNKQNEVLKLEQDLSKEEASNNRLMVILLIFILTSLAFWTYRVKRNQIKLKRQSETDLLTGVSSRQHFYFMCRKTLEHAKKTNQEVTFVLFDMDGFKSVNDNYGHLVGDWVLKKAVSVCIPCWRKNDIAGRLGGEEFALMLPTCNMERAQEIAEQCRKAIEAVDTSDSGHKFPLSASFGITTTRFSGYEFSKVIGDADKTMYQAKAAGKNQVCCVEISDN